MTTKFKAGFGCWQPRILHVTPFLSPLCTPLSKSTIIYLKLNCPAITSRHQTFFRKWQTSLTATWWTQEDENILLLFFHVLSSAGKSVLGWFLTCHRYTKNHRLPMLQDWTLLKKSISCFCPQNRKEESCFFLVSNYPICYLYSHIIYSGLIRNSLRFSN